MKQFEHLTVGDALLILGALSAVGVAVRKAWPRARDFVLFLTDLMGTPARHGLDAKPGLMEVVADLAAAQQRHDERLTRVEETAATAASAAAASTEGVHHLSGQVAEVDRKVDEVAAEQTRVRSALEELRRAGMDAATDQTGSTS